MIRWRSGGDLEVIRWRSGGDPVIPTTSSTGFPCHQSSCLVTPLTPNNYSFNLGFPSRHRLLDSVEYCPGTYPNTLIPRFSRSSGPLVSRFLRHQGPSQKNALRQAISRNSTIVQELRNPPKTTLWRKYVRFSHRTVSITLNPTTFHVRMT